MLFNTFLFLVFFIVVLVISRLIGPWRLRKLFLLLASYVFYAAWNPIFIVLLWLSTLVDWFVARRLDWTLKESTRRWLLGISLLTNLGMLGLFKYGQFIVDNLVILGNLGGQSFTAPRLDIVLPVGISFYTFQTLSYTLDIFRRQSRPSRSFLDYALYVSFFPQLVAGPIVRAVDFLPQCLQARRASAAQLSWGIQLLIIGLFFKVVIADSLMSPITEKVFDQVEHPGLVESWSGTLAFTMQIFSDFFGYSTCAVGIALALGFVLPDNFRFPYAAVGFSDFWRRWHISLSTWLRDYLYVSLGGNHHGTARTLANLMITMLLGGLWHGASWMFVIWGGLHGLYLITERLLRLGPWAKLRIWHHWPVQGLLILATFGCICLTWVFFRATSLDKALWLSTSMLDLRQLGGTISLQGISRAEVLVVLLTTAAMLALHIGLRQSSIEALFQRLPWFARAVVMASMAYLTLIAIPGEDRAFIYFQF